MKSSQRLLILLALVPILVVGGGVIYMVGMDRLEGEQRTFWDSIEFAAETISTTGYGGDSRWTHPAMVIFIILLQFIGVFLVFLVFPIYLVPYLEERFEGRLPTRVPDKMTEHVIIFRYGSTVESLLEQLARRDRLFVVIELEEEPARKLLERGIPVVFGATEEDVVNICNLDRARTIIANGSEEENAGLILRVRHAGYDGPIYAIADVPGHRRPLELAGATAVYTPKHILAAALAARTSQRISPRLSGLQQLGEHVELRELRVHRQSALANRALSEIAFGNEAGVTVIGQWFEGHLHTQLSAETLIKPGSILIVVGRSDRIEELVAEAEGAVSLRHEGPILIAGFGEVGRKVHQLLTDAGENVVTVDRELRSDIDVHGSVLDQSTLDQAGIREAQAIILALDTDDATLFATVIIRDYAPDVPIVARVNQQPNVENIYRAGADFALSISHVTGQMLSGRIVGEQTHVVDEHLKVMKFDGKGIAGQHPSTLDIRRRTGASIVAVERSDQVFVSFPEDFRFEPDDTVYICGSDQSLQHFRRQYG
ncbi:MAG: NAD-binding protein [Thermoanaerobaculia bacterium]|nr:NAD-binding protein [Thermoanaerobaculia bacterium]